MARKMDDLCHKVQFGTVDNRALQAVRYKMMQTLIDKNLEKNAAMAMGRVLFLAGLLGSAGFLGLFLRLSAESETVLVEPTKQVKVKARRFKFVPSRIKVEAGTTLEIVLSSQDVRHGFKIVGTNIDVQIPARGKGQVKVTFRTDQAGQYRFECSHVCGAGHASMRGVIQVAGRKKQAPPSGPEERGKRE